MRLSPIQSLSAVLIAMMITVAANIAGARSLEDLVDDAEPPWLSESLLRSRVQERTGSEPATGEDGERGEREPLETDRDSFTFAITTVGAGRIMVESAYSYIDNRKVPDSNSFPEMITRVGLTDRFELRLGWNYEVGGGGDVSNGDAAGDLEEPGRHRESQLMYGFKYELNEQRSWIPGSACIVQGSTPTSGPNSSGRLIVGYVFGWKFLDDWKLDSAIRYETTKEAGDNFNQWAPSVVLKVPVFERCDLHGEYFGIFTDGKAHNTNSQYLSPGISYLLTPDLEVGVRLGWGISQDAAAFFSNVGFGLRF